MIRAALCLLLLFGPNTWSQTAEVTARPEQDVSDAAAATLTLDQAILLARKNAPQFRAALTEAGLAREDRVQARAALLPDVSYTTGAIYTEANGTPTGAFIAANSVHEYISQGVVHEALSFSSVADFRRARFMESLVSRPELK